MSKKSDRRDAKAAKKKARRDYRADRRDQKSQRQDQRQEGKAERREIRQEGKTSRTDLRTEARRDKIKYKGESGYWSPEGIEARQPWDALQELGSDVVAAFGGGSSEPESGYAPPYTEPTLPGQDDEELEEEVGITEQPWFLPALGVGAVGVYLMTRPKAKGRK